MRLLCSRELLGRWYFLLIALAPICIVMMTPLDLVKRTRAPGQYVRIDQLQAELAEETLLPIELIYVPKKSEWVFAGQ